MAKEIISWIDADGTEYDLTSGNYRVLMGAEGRFMPPFSFAEETVPFQYGSVLRQVTIQPREVDLPLLVKATDRIELRLRLRELLHVFNPVRGDGKLRVTAPDGSQRELYCRYIGGLEISESTDSKGPSWQKLILVLKAFDPFWYDTITNVRTFTAGEPATFFPFFPVRLSSSTVFADTSVENTGDIETWPEWIITGPGSDIYLRNLTTGEILHLNTTLQEGETITIDTRPGKKTVKKSDGTNLFGSLSDDSSLWALRQGNNNIRIEMSSATGNSSVQLSYRNRYLGA
jgi:hypothetical protein